MAWIPCGLTKFKFEEKKKILNLIIDCKDIVNLRAFDRGISSLYSKLGKLKPRNNDKFVVNEIIQVLGVGGLLNYNQNVGSSKRAFYERLYTSIGDDKKMLKIRGKFCMNLRTFLDWLVSVMQYAWLKAKGMTKEGEKLTSLNKEVFLENKDGKVMVIPNLNDAVSETGSEFYFQPLIDRITTPKGSGMMTQLLDHLQRPDMIGDTEYKMLLKLFTGSKESRKAAYHKISPEAPSDVTAYLLFVVIFANVLCRWEKIELQGESQSMLRKEMNLMRDKLQEELQMLREQINMYQADIEGKEECAKRKFADLSQNCSIWKKRAKKYNYLYNSIIMKLETVDLLNKRGTPTDLENSSKIVTTLLARD